MQHSNPFRLEWRLSLELSFINLAFGIPFLWCACSARPRYPTATALLHALLNLGSSRLFQQYTLLFTSTIRPVVSGTTSR